MTKCQNHRSKTVIVKWCAPGGARRHFRGCAPGVRAGGARRGARRASQGVRAGHLRGSAPGTSGDPKVLRSGPGHDLAENVIFGCAPGARQGARRVPNKLSNPAGVILNNQTRSVRQTGG